MERIDVILDVDLEPTLLFRRVAWYCLHDRHEIRKAKSRESEQLAVEMVVLLGEWEQAHEDEVLGADEEDAES